MQTQIYDTVMQHIQDSAWGLPVLWPDTDTPAETNGAHVSLSFVGAGTANQSLCGGGGRYRFLLTILLRLPAGSLYGAATEYLDQLSNTFPAGLRFGSNTGKLTVLNPPDTRPPYTANGWYTVPVLIYFQSIQ